MESNGNPAALRRQSSVLEPFHADPAEQRQLRHDSLADARDVVASDDAVRASVHTSFLRQSFSAEMDPRRRSSVQVSIPPSVQHQPSLAALTGPSLPLVTALPLGSRQGSQPQVQARNVADHEDSEDEYYAVLQRNRQWVQSRLMLDVGYFQRLKEGQKPPFLYFGCSDSRVPLNTMTQTQPGDIFVHRNIANQVRETDMNAQSVLEFAVGHLKVRHIIVAGHTQCGGVRFAYDGLGDVQEGAIDYWLAPLRSLAHRHSDRLQQIEDRDERLNYLVKLNVMKQILSVCTSPVMVRHFRQGVYPMLHGWIINIGNGLIEELPLPVAEWKKLNILPTSYPDTY